MKKSASQESRGLKTFFVYALIVLFFIFISLSVKIFFVVKSSKFDERHNFALSVIQKEIVKKVILYNPSQSTIATVDLKGEDVNEASAVQILGFIPDATIETNNKVNTESGTSTLLRNIGFQYNSVKTNLTLLDIVRLLIVSHKTTHNDEQVIIKDNNYTNDNDIKSFFVDDEISSEDISVQIINASGLSGLAKRLETNLSRLGCNVISVNTSQKKVVTSSIQYFEEKSYTLQRLQKLLKFPVKELTDKQIADIVIVIGEDSKDTQNF